MKLLKLDWLTWAIILVIVIGSILRLYQLGQVPGGLGWDEAAIGYNGWSIWTTTKDERLHRLPFSFQSFGDYKAPLAIYLNGPFTLLFGMNTFAVRLPFALFACATLIVWWRLLALMRHQLGFSPYFVLYGTALLAFSPWHFVFSRTAFESGISLFFVLLGVFLLFMAIYSSKRQKLLFILSSLSLVASLYTYHSAKIVVPLLSISIILIWQREIRKVWKQAIPGIAIGLVTLVPLTYDSFIGQGATRANDLIFMKADSLNSLLQSIASSVLAHADLNFLLLGKGDELRHVIGSFGILLPGTLVFTILGIWSFVLSRNSQRPETTARSKFALFSLVWLFIGLLPGYFSVVFPHANRTLIALPALLLMASFGFEYVHSQYQSKRSNGTALLLSTIITIDILWSVGFLNVYFTKYQLRAEDIFQSGYQRAVQEVNRALHESKPVDEVIFSSAYGQPYIYLLFYNATSPHSFHQGALVKFFFPENVTIADVSRDNALLVFTPKDPLVEKVKELPVSSITGLSGTTRFYLLHTRDVPK